MGKEKGKFLGMIEFNPSGYADAFMPGFNTKVVGLKDHCFPSHICKHTGRPSKPLFDPREFLPNPNSNKQR